ncbi:hypothetical protein [Streptomyces sp. NPDC127092]|uniref:hypothetical protein n=1 Tax=Streptomyces sp. NPDC127092 TaxID=3347135 RepID=UPI00364C0EC4
MRRVAAAALVLGMLATPASAPSFPSAPSLPSFPSLPTAPYAPPAPSPSPSRYQAAPDTQRTRTGALLPGPGTYADDIAKGETRSYRVRLDGSTNVFLSAVLTPVPGAAIDVVDGISLSLRTPSGQACGLRTDVRFYGDTARPVADYVSRRVEPGRDCQEPGEYVLDVEGVGRDTGSQGKPWRWPVEIGYVEEAAPGSDVPAPLPPTAWSTEPPAGALGDGETRPVRGGTGFNDAPPLAGSGSWRDELRPGESRFYRVPVRWRQQLFARARFGNAEPPPGGSALPDGLRLALYNPARGAVDERKGLYTGEPATLLLGTAPAAYANRTQGATESVGAMRFAGDYYLQLTLDRRAPVPVPLALDLTVATPSPAHAAAPAPGRSAGPVSGADSGPASGLESGPASDPAQGGASAAGPDPVLRAVGIAGVSTGTALVASLAAWPLLPSRRRPRLRSRPRGRHARGA